MKSSGKTTRSAPRSRALPCASRTFSALPLMSPTVGLSCASAILNRETAVVALSVMQGRVRRVSRYSGSLTETIAAVVRRFNAGGCDGRCGPRVRRSVASAASPGRRGHGAAGGPPILDAVGRAGAHRGTAVMRRLRVDQRACRPTDPPHAALRAVPSRLRFRRSAIRNASSSAWSALRRGSQCV